MGQSTTYRARWRAALGDLELLQAMYPALALPLGRPRAYSDVCEDVSLVADGVSIAGLVPLDDAPEPAFWTFDGTYFTFTADLLNPATRQDKSAFAEIGEPSRERILLETLAATCGADDNTIVGAWMGEHSHQWNPLVFTGGRIVRAFVGYRNHGYAKDGARQHDGRLPQGIEIGEHGTVSIPDEAFA